MDNDELCGVGGGALWTISKSAMLHPEEVINHFFISYQLEITCMTVSKRS